MAAGQDAKPEQPEKVSEASAASRQVQLEKERLTRRTALRKFGFGAGMAALMALSVDDLARMAAVKLQQHAGDSKVANAVAQEFKNAGVAFANPSGTSACDNCVSAKESGLELALGKLADCRSAGGTEAACQRDYTNYSCGVRNTFIDCCNLNSCNCGPLQPC